MEAYKSHPAMDATALQSEVVKLQERVPKLAAALRDRTQELSAARDEIARLRRDTVAAVERGPGETDRDGAAPAAAGGRAALQASLVQALAVAADMAQRLEALPAEASVPESQAAVLSAARAEVASLRERNASLQTNVALANKRMSELGTELVELNDSRAAALRRSAELQEQVRNLENRTAQQQAFIADLEEELARAREQSGVAADLTRIRGLGDKLALQLADSGYTSCVQLAQLDLEALHAADHPLHALRSRIARGQWIDQARALVEHQ